jgi:DNA-binding GntR family transcriptional regulator
VIPEFPGFSGTATAAFTSEVADHDVVHGHTVYRLSSHCKAWYTVFMKLPSTDADAPESFALTPLATVEGPSRRGRGRSDSGALTTRTYDLLRERIILGAYPQGSRLSEARIADDLGVSRVPVRDAIPRLRSAGFVMSRPRGGIEVWYWTQSSVNEVYELRGNLEAMTARLAARAVANGASPIRVRETLLKAGEALATEDRLVIAEATHEFHSRIVDLAGNNLLSSLMESITERMIWLMYLTWEGAVQAVTDEHADILHAIERGNEELAAAIAYAHVERARPSSLLLFPHEHPRHDAEQLA